MDKGSGENRRQLDTIPVDRTQRRLRQAIHKLIADSPSGRLLHRLHLLILLREGIGASQIREWYAVSERSLLRWNQQFDKNDVDGLQESRHQGRPGRLDRQQMEMLKMDLETDPVHLGYGHNKWTGRLLCSHIRELFNVKMSVRQCQRLLREIGGKDSSDL